MKVIHGIKQAFWHKMKGWFDCPSMTTTAVFALFLPILVDQGFVVLLNLLNTAMISSSGVEAVSAVNMVDSINLFLMNVFIAVATGGTVIIAQYKGAGHPEMISKATAQALTAVTALGLILGGLMIVFHGPLLQGMFGKADPLVMSYATIYLIGSCATYPLFALYQMVVGALRGVGDSKASLFLSLILNGSYVILNLVFVTLLQWGIYGLLISLVVSRLLGVIVAIVYMIRYCDHLSVSPKDIFTIDIAFQKRIFSIGVPFAAEQMFFNGGKLLTQIFIVQLGTLALTVNAISATFLGLMQVSGAAMSLTVITMVGQCVGKKRIEDAKKLTVSGMKFASVAMLLWSLLVMLFFMPLLSLFSPPEEIVSTILLLVTINVIVEPFGWCISFVLPAALRAGGDAKFTSIASMCSMWLLRVVLGYMLAIPLGFGIVGVWIAMYFEWFVRGTIFFMRFKGTKWYQHKLIDDEVQPTK